MGNPITKSQTEKAYEYAKLVYAKTVKRSDAVKDLYEKYGMSKGSAGDYIQNLKKMLQGEKYTRTLNPYATEHYLGNIAKDFGAESLQLALSALEQHLDYYQSLPHGGPQHDNRALLECYKRGVFDRKIYPDEVDDVPILIEGAKRQVVVNAYERNPEARRKCIESYGCFCQGCGFDFFECYGEIGKDFIHVHHLVEISSIANEYEVDPVRDLRPVCPNCHAMLHRRKPAFTIDELKGFLKKKAA